VALQDLLNLIGGIGLTVLGWFGRELWSAVKELKTDLAKLREELPKTYAQRMMLGTTSKRSNRC
jgi:hypothetical protein